MRTFALASGSSGNCFYVESNEGIKVLVDLGLSFKRTKEILAQRGIDMAQIDAVFITHEHSDHARGLDNFLKNTKAKIYLSRGTFEGLDFDLSRAEIIGQHEVFTFKDLRVFSIAKPHDTVDALSYVFESEGRKIGIFTDMGYVTGEMKNLLKELDVVYFEANYSKEVIGQRKGLSSIYVNRLVSDSGHLDLDDACSVLSENCSNEQTIVLSHISENTNSYEFTYRRVKESFESVGKLPQIFVSFQGEPSEWF